MLRCWSHTHCHWTLCVCVCVSSRAGISEMFEGHHGPITGTHCHTAAGPVDFSHLFLTASFDWTVKLWSTKVTHSIHVHSLRYEVIDWTLRNDHMISLWCRITSRCTRSRITRIMFMMSCGLRCTPLSSHVWTDSAESTCGTSTMIQRLNAHRQ